MFYNMVSIITPTYNCGNFIAKTIESVLSQTYSNWEMIIVDDCSTDNTKEIVSRYSDKRIQYHCLERNNGAAVARNEALRLAKGRFIAFLDSDDLWTPEKLERQIKFMRDNDYSFSFHGYEEIDEEDLPTGVSVRGKKHIGRFGMYCCCWPGCLTVMYDAEKIGLVEIENLRKNNDFAMWLKIIKKTKCHYLDESLAFYRRRRGSLTPPSILDRIKWHYTLFRQSECKSQLSSFFFTCLNVFGNAYKKIFYIRRH